MGVGHEGYPILDAGRHGTSLNVGSQLNHDVVPTAFAGLPVAIATRPRKIPNLVVPENAREAAVVSGLNVYPVRSLISGDRSNQQRKWRYSP
jgi:hypothetical protein